MLDLEASIPRILPRVPIHACISARYHYGYDSKPRTQNSTSLCALILFAAVNHARFFSGSRIQRPITNREAPCPAWAATTGTIWGAGFFNYLNPAPQTANRPWRGDP